MSLDRTRTRDTATATIRRGAPVQSGINASGRYDFECYGPALALVDGEEKNISKAEIEDYRAVGFNVEILEEPKLKWSDYAVTNLVVNEGLDHVLDSTIAGGTQITSWFVGLTDNSPTPAAGDTLASHAGWTEFDEYTGNRQAYTADAVSGQSVDNSSSVASFPINNDTNGGLGGAFLASVATGTGGTLFSAVALSGGNRVVNNGDTVEVTYTFTAADDGV